MISFYNIRETRNRGSNTATYKHAMYSSLDVRCLLFYFVAASYLVPTDEILKLVICEVVCYV